MSLRPRVLTLSALLLLSGSLAAGCGGGDGDEGFTNRDTGTTTPDAADASTTPDAAPDAGTDTVTPDTSDDTTDPGDAGDDAEADTSRPPILDPAIFIECGDGRSCTSGQSCIEGVCVRNPTSTAFIAEEYIDIDGTRKVREFRDRGPELGCFEDDYAPAEGPATATLRGQLDRFGKGAITIGLCVSTWDEEMLLPFLVNHDCHAIDPTEDPDSFVQCFKLDPCRCADAFDASAIARVRDEALDSVAAAELATDSTIGDTDACMAFIGACNQIADAGARGACEARVAEKTGVSGSLLLGYTRSFERSETETEFESLKGGGAFEIPNFPTNRRFAFKASGEKRNWRDTWEYGLFSRADLVNERGNLVIGANAVGQPTWDSVPVTVGLINIEDVNGAIAGSVRDCGSSEHLPYNIHGATFATTTDPSRLAYFNADPENTVPVPNRTETNVLGTYAAVDLKAGPNRVAAAVKLANGDIVPVAARNVYQTPGSIIIASFEGLF